MSKLISRARQSVLTGLRHGLRAGIACFGFGLAFTPVVAGAPPLAGLVVGVVSGLGFTGTALSLSVGLGVYGGSAVFIGSSIGAFLAGVGGQLLVGLAGTALQSLFAKKQQAPTIEAARYVSRVSVPKRWIHGGYAPGGGSAIFGEFDATGAFWWIVIHSDSRLIERDKYILDEIPVEVDEDGWVLTAEFRKGQKESGANLIRLFTRTYTVDDPTPPGVSELTAAISDWTAENHLLVGTTYTVGYMAPMTAQEQQEARFSRGPINVGEPSTVVVGWWDGMYDPRDEDQDIDDPSTWKKSTNPSILWAWWRTHPWGRNKPMSKINWTRVAEQADICDISIEDRDGFSAPQYSASTAVPDNKSRMDAENEILGSCDGKVFFDDEGKAWMKVGSYVVPTVTISENRDILSIQSSQVQNGEAPLDGVVVTYLDPVANFAETPCAPWKNPNYYDESRSPNYLPVTIQTIQNHRQAVQVAKAIGLREQPTIRLAPMMDVVGLLLSEETTVDLDYEDLEGIYEIASPLEEDRNGLVTQCGLVPVDENRWTLLEGEEGAKPVTAVASSVDTTLSPPDAGVWSVAAAPVPGSNGAAVRLDVTMTPPARVDYTYQFEYKKSTESIWRPMLSLSQEGIAYSDTVEDGLLYDVRARTVTTSGRASDWGATKQVTAIADATPPDDLSSAEAVAGLGNFVVTAVTQASENPPLRIAIYANQGGALDRETDEIVVFSSGSAQTIQYPYGDTTRTNRIGDPSFDSGSGWSTDDFTISGGEAEKTTTASDGYVRRPVVVDSGETYRYGIQSSAVSGSGVFPVLSAPSPVDDVPGSAISTGLSLGTVDANGNSDEFGVKADTTSTATIEAIYLYEETGGCIAQGTWQIWVEPQNGSGVPGTVVGPITISVI